jgi:copper chaperone NosL
MMRPPPSVPALLALVCALALAACARDEVSRCRECGMRVDGDPRFLAGANLDGRELLFDTPKCLFRFLASEDGRRAEEAWAVEYYSGERRALRELRFVVGSDVLGPMGDDLIPVGEHAERFARDHGGRVLERRVIDHPTLEALH